MTTLAKAGITITGIGTVGGGIAIANNLLRAPAPEVKEKTLLNRLTDEGFEEVPEDQWQTIFDAYKAITDKPEIKFEKANDKEESLEKLKKKCQGILSEKEDSEDNYKKARQWCVKPEDISAILVRGKYKVLSTSTEDDVTLWTKKAGSLKNNTEAAKFLNVEIASKDEQAIATKLKDICALLKLGTTKTVDKEFNDNFDKGRVWCSEKK